MRPAELHKLKSRSDTDVVGGSQLFFISFHALWTSFNSYGVSGDANIGCDKEPGL
jgi:hypothetical protein